MANLRGGDGQTATKLANGKVLVTGLSPTAELFDPATGTWRQAGTLKDARGGQTATLLEDGRVLIAGGVGSNDDGVTTAEIYDPATGTWTSTAAMPEGRISGQAVRLSDGRVLVAGGISHNSSDGSNAVKSAVIYTPSTGD
jgi:N-acetylneuraminic acid mutarotase